MLTLQHAVLLKQKFKEFPVPKGWTNVNTMEHLSPGEPDYYVLKRTDGDFTLTLLTSSTCIVNMSDVDEDLDDEPQAEEEEEDEESYGLSMLLALERPGSKKPLLLELFFSDDEVRILGAMIGYNPASNLVNIHGGNNGLYTMFYNMRADLYTQNEELFKSTSLKHFVDLNPPVQNAIQQAIAKHLSPELLNYLLESISQDQNKQFIQFLARTAAWLDE